MGQKISTKLPLIAAVWLSCLPRCNCAAVRLDTNETLLQYVTTKYRFFGKQSGTIEAPAILLDKEHYDEFCMNERNISASYQSKIIFIPASYFDLTCGGKFGSFADFSYISKWCTLVGTTFIRTAFREPGILANENDGDHFRSILAAKPDLKDCSIFDANAGSEGLDAFLNSGDASEGIPFRLEIDENHAVSLFGSTPVVLIRGTLAIGYFYIFLEAHRVVHERQSQNRISLILYLILGLIKLVSLSLGIVEVGGSHYMGSFWSLGVVYFFQTNLFGASVAQNILISILFHQITQITLHQKKAEFKLAYKALVLLSTLLVIGDAVVALLLSKSMDISLLRAAQLLVPVVLILIQIIISGYQWYTTRRVVWALQRVVEAKCKKLSDTQEIQNQLLGKVVWGVRLSLFADILSTCALAISKYMYASRYLLLLVTTFLALSRLLSLFAQMSMCRPIDTKRSTKSAQN